jgi:hypothetical protein
MRDLLVLALATDKCCLFPHEVPYIPIKGSNLCRWIEFHKKRSIPWSELGVLSGSTSLPTSSATALLRFLPSRLRRLTRLALLPSLFTLLLGLSCCLFHAVCLLVGGDFHEAAAVGHVVGVLGIRLLSN